MSIAEQCRYFVDVYDAIEESVLNESVVYVDGNDRNLKYLDDVCLNREDTKDMIEFSGEDKDGSSWVVRVQTRAI
jgi:hypothetical protein